MPNSIEIVNKNSQDKVKTDFTSLSQKIVHSYLYMVKIQRIDTESQIADLKNYCFYLNLLLEESNPVQTPCIDIDSSKDSFELKTTKKILKIEVIDYNTMRKVAKIGLKGTNKQFNINYQDTKQCIKIEIYKRNCSNEEQIQNKIIFLRKVKSMNFEPIIFTPKSNKRRYREFDN